MYLFVYVYWVERFVCFRVTDLVSFNPLEALFGQERWNGRPQRAHGCFASVVELVARWGGGRLDSSGRSQAIEEYV